MRSSYPLAGIHALVIACFVSASALAPAAHAQSAPLAKPNAASLSSQHALLRQMVGTWNVEQRIWTGPKTEPIKPPPAVARRRLIGDAFIEEVMEAAPGSGQDPFTRIAYFNYTLFGLEFESLRGVFLPKQSPGFERIASRKDARNDSHKMTRNEFTTTSRNDIRRSRWTLAPRK